MFIKYTAAVNLNTSFKLITTQFFCVSLVKHLKTEIFIHDIHVAVCVAQDIGIFNTCVNTTFCLVPENVYCSQTGNHL